MCEKYIISWVYTCTVHISSMSELIVAAGLAQNRMQQGQR